MKRPRGEDKYDKDPSPDPEGVPAAHPCPAECRWSFRTRGRLLDHLPVEHHLTRDEVRSVNKAQEVGSL